MEKHKKRFIFLLLALLGAGLWMGRIRREWLDA